MLKLLIHYLDEDASNVKHVLNLGGMERLICLLANSGIHHPSVTKNASCALARLLKSRDPNVMQLCRELRGIEILVELDKSGRLVTRTET